MARAASAVHQDVFGLLVAYLRNLFEWTIRFEILHRLVRYNFGEEDANRLTPLVSLGDTDVQDIPKLMGVISQLALAGVLHESQYPGVSAKLRIPPANEEERQKDLDLARQTREAAAKSAVRAAEAPPAPSAPPGAPGAPGAGGRPEPKAAPAPAKKSAVEQAREAILAGTYGFEFEEADE